MGVMARWVRTAGRGSQAPKEAAKTLGLSRAQSSAARASVRIEPERQ